MVATGTMLYTPGVKVLIALSATGKIIDISEDIESGNMTLRENNPHSLNLTVSNANGKYGGVFTPNDKIIVQMKRVTWLQVFSGYLNSVPYFQAFPGSINLSASCTLKRLKFNFWDPAYQETINFIAQAYEKGFGAGGTATTATTAIGPNGKQIQIPAGDILSTQGLTTQTDSGMKSVLVNILTQIIGWDQSKIHIGGIPTDWIQKLQPIWNDLQVAITNDIISASASASAAAVGTGTTAAGVNVGPGGQYTSADWAASVIQQVKGVVTSNTVTAFLHWMAAEEPANAWWNGTSFNPLNIGPGHQYANLTESASATAQALNQTGYGYEAIVSALSESAVSLADFATAVVQSSWNPGNGGVGGEYYNNIVGSQPNPNSLAPVNGGSVVLATSSYLNTGTGGDSATQGAYTPGSATAGALLATASGGPALTQIGTNSNTGAAQASGASLAVEYAQAHWNDNKNQDIGSGDDCSAFTAACWAAGGVQIPSNTVAQYNDKQIVIVTVDQILPGDILFGAGADPPPPGHVAMYIGNNTVVQHDPQRSSTLADWIKGQEGEGGFYGAGRVTAASQSNTGTHGTQSPSATQISTGAGNVGGVGTPSGGLAGDANGSLIYGSGLWDPAGSPGDPIDAALTGFKVLMKDQPIMPYISDVAHASLRNFCSAPNGDFIAWFPDYFGQYGYAATWHLSLVELIDFTVNWSDEDLVTHQYVAGSVATDNLSLDPLSGGNVDDTDLLFTYGVATIDMPGLLEALTGINPDDPGIFANVNQIYQQFGARPNMTSMPTVAAPSLAAFWFAVRQFQENWAGQFSCNVQTTFMPELWPGMLLAVDELGFQCYVESVTHSWDLQDGGGFTTSVGVTAPSSMASGPTGAASADSTGGLLGLARSGPQTP